MMLSGTVDFAYASKLQPHHQERLAVVYVRQSTLQQVHDHQESTRLQYGLTAYAQQLGWPSERILVIDDDLGKSGSTVAGRVGFQRLVTEVTLNHVGLIVGLEMSRLARSNTDWHHLLEICALFRTLIADQDGLYDPVQYNDRLLLGLKGTMSEAELHVLKQRLHQGKLSKARRGELSSALPIGYLRQPDGEIAFDPDEQAQHIVRLIFRKFDELGTLHAVLRYLVRHGIQLGVRERCGQTKGRLVWRRPNRMTLQNLLRHPIYAGAYSYGRRQTDPRRKQPGRVSTGRVVQSPEHWHVLLRDRVPAYISWEVYQANLTRLTQNRSLAETRGSARKGEALLGGLVVCGMCSRRMAVRYREGHAAYICQNFATNYGGTTCQHIVGDELEHWVAMQVLRALEPASLALSLEATRHVEAERDDLEQLWQQRLEQASYEAERAQRQYAAVEPEHRLVARQLEAGWEKKLAEQRQLQEAYTRFRHEQPQLLTSEQIEAIGQLAQDLPRLWSAPTTTMIDRKQILRAVMERIVLHVIDHSERVQVEIFWAGGHLTRQVVWRPVQRADQLSYYAQVCAEIRIGVEEGESMEQTVQRLNALEWRSPRGQNWGRQAVQELRSQLGLHRKQGRQAKDGLDGRNGRWSITALARQIGMPAGRLRYWIEQGQVAAEQMASGRWVIQADQELIEQLRQRSQKSVSTITWQRWQESLEEQKNVTQANAKTE